MVPAAIAGLRPAIGGAACVGRPRPCIIPVVLMLTTDHLSGRAE